MPAAAEAVLRDYSGSLFKGCDLFLLIILGQILHKHHLERQQEAPRSPPAAGRHYIRSIQAEMKNNQRGNLSSNFPSETEDPLKLGVSMASGLLGPVILSPNS